MKAEYFGAFIKNGCTVLGANEGYENLKTIYPFKECVFEKDFEEDHSTKVLNENSVSDFCMRLKKTIMENKEGFPVTIGGDHSLAIGSVSASYRENMGLIWIDAHGDSNTDEITISGRIHGMPVSILQGLGPKKCVEVCEGNYLKPENILFFGTHALDSLEEKLMHERNMRLVYMEEIREKGIEQCIQTVVDFFKDKELYVSCDIDSMDPKIAPGVSIPEEGGLFDCDVYQLLEALFTKCNVIGMDVVEYNPRTDLDNRTLQIERNLFNLIEKYHK